MEVLHLDLPEAGFLLVSREVLKEITIAYETYGRLNEQKSNAIYICHPLTGNAHVSSGSSEKEGWWDFLIGPGKFVDTNEFFVICSNVLGGCYGTTGPASTNPDTGKPYGREFPQVTMKDSVRVQKRLLDQLGIPVLHCVIGGSMGGMQALEWSIAYPDYVRRCICIASGANLTSQALAFSVIARQSIELDKKWHQGNYYAFDENPFEGLARARQIGHVTYLSPKSMDMKFGRGQQQGNKNYLSKSKFATDFQVESYLNYQGKKFSQRFDANSYLHLCQMMDIFDLAKEYGSLQKAFSPTNCAYLIISVSSDWLFPPSQSLEIVSSLLSSRKPVSYFQLQSDYGHDAFLMSSHNMGKGIKAFINGYLPEGIPESINRMDTACISNMIASNMHILDVGSGRGNLMWALKKEKKISGICLDLNFDNIVSCMNKGLPAIQCDADAGLDMIPAGSFDCVLLNQTIQQLRSALQTLKQLLRIAGNAVIGFPNFAYYNYRMKLFLEGRLPLLKNFPFEWYNSPNIHLVTIKDFRDLCERHSINIEEIHYISDSWMGKCLLFFGIVNLGSERSVVKIKSNQ